MFTNPHEFRQPRRNRELEARQIKRQVRIVERIVQQLDAPLSLHVRGLAHELRLLSRGPLMAARSRLVMNQVRVWRPNVSETRCLQTQTKINVIETDTEVDFIEPIEFSKKLLPHDHTCARDG